MGRSIRRTTPEELTRHSLFEEITEKNLPSEQLEEALDILQFSQNNLDSLASTVVKHSKDTSDKILKF
jgi:hypothetical protein